MIRLRHLTVRGFGALALPTTPVEFADDRVTLLLGPNEAGKTTLAEALYAALYGMEHRRSTKYTPLPLEERWRPRGGDDAAFGVRLSLLANDRMLLADWDFAERSLRVTDERTGKDVTDEFHAGRNRYDLGKRVTGLSDEEFRKVCYVAQGELNSTEGLAGIAGLVQRYAATSPGTGRTASEAIQAIEAVMARYPASTQGKGALQIDNELERLDGRLGEIAVQLTALSQRRADASEAEDEYERLCAEERTVQAKIEALHALRSSAELQELRDRIARADATTDRIKALQAEREQLAHLHGFPAQEAEALTRLDARIQELASRSEAVQKKISTELAPLLDARQRELETFGPLAKISDAEVRALEALAVRASDNARQLRRANDELEAEHRRLAAAGDLPAEYEALRKELGSLSDDALGQAAGYSAKRAELQGAMATVQSEFQETGRRLTALLRRSARSKTIAMLAGGLGVLTVLCTLLLPQLDLSVSVPSSVLLTVGTLLTAAGIALRFTLGSTPAEVARLREVQGAKDHERADLQQAIRQVREDMERRASACALQSTETLAEKAVRLLELQRRTAAFMEIRRKVADLSETQDALLKEALGSAARFAYPLDRADISASLQAFAEQARKAATSAQALSQAEEQMGSLQADLATIKDGLASAASRAKEITAGAGIDETNLKAALAEFASRTTQHQRLVQVEEDLLPRQRESVPDEATLAKWRARVASLEPHAQGESNGLSASELSDRIDAQRRELDQLSRDRHNIGMHIHALLAECRERVPLLEEEREQLETHRAKVVRHRDALRMALEELHNVAAETHREWADELNRRAGDYLSAFAPTLSRLRFDDDLGFTAIQSGNDLPFDPTGSGPTLSAGQRDQLYLAVRLGIADFLGSRDNALPLILDDPFVNFDDTRYAAGMRFLVERALPHHQVVLFTCHRQRVEWLRREDPKWFDRHVVLRQIPGGA